MPTTLQDLIGKIDSLDEEDVIFVRGEWCEDADAEVFRLTSNFRPPDEAVRLGYTYFLEVDVARQVLTWFRDKPDASLGEKTRRVIHYAIYDA